MAYTGRRLTPILSRDREIPKVSSELDHEEIPSSIMAMTEFPPMLSEQEMRDNKVPLAWRDRCAALLVPLNKCRAETKFVPWECTQLRHDYEECQYLDLQRRKMEYKQLKQEQ